MIKNLTESLLPQPPSFAKKKSYDVQQVLGTGTFGKVMVRLIKKCLILSIKSDDHRDCFFKSERRGMSQLIRSH